MTYAEVIKNPAIASKCQRMVLKRSNDAWESTHIPSSCSIVNDPEEDAIKVCKEVSLNQILEIKSKLHF